MFNRGVTLSVVTLFGFNIVLMICADGGGGLEGDPGTSLCSEVCAAYAHGLEVARDFCNKCKSIKEIPVVDVGVSIDRPELICHDRHNLSIRWNLNGYQEDEHFPLFFVSQLETINADRSPNKYYNVTSSTISTFHGLPPNSSFNATIRAATSQGWAGAPLHSTFWTHSSDRLPAGVDRIWWDEPQMLDDIEKEGNRVFEVNIHWEPSKDMTCAYDVQLMSIKNDYPTPQQAYSPGSSYTATFVGLQYETDYNVVVSAHFSEYVSSNSTKNKFTTPACWEYLRNLTVCVPPKPIIRFSDEFVSAPVLDNGTSHRSYNVRVTWMRPELRPDEYIVTLVTDTNHTYQITNLTGSSESVFFEGVLMEQNYITYVEAVSAKGRSQAAWRRFNIQHLLDAERKPRSGVGGVVVFALAIPACSLLACLALAAFIYRRHKMILHKNRCKYFEELERKAPPESSNVSVYFPSNLDAAGLGGSSTLSVSATAAAVAEDRFELKPERLSLLEALGEGAFGLVRRALLKGERGDETEVAVKMLKDQPTADEARQFRCEIEMMKSVGAHPHIVSMLGACTRATCALLVVEYCARGDLQNYLRYAWEVLSSKRKWSTPNIDYTKKNGYSKLESDSGVDLSTLVVNRLYDLDISTDTEITAVDLLSFSRQIAMGMEFLSSNRVVHRDLAARNILVCADKTVKIADFGLSRDIYQNNMYKKTTGGKLPIKWMAIESLTHQIYTTHSDVWSFGVVLWEIATLGGNPYPSVPTGRLLKMLLSGHRMECPANCSAELYGLMSSCWHACAVSRPTFAYLRRRLDQLLNGACSKDYLNLEVLHDIQHFRQHMFEQPPPHSKVCDESAEKIAEYKSFDSECYVKPISKSSSKEALRTTQNHYSDMPMLPAPSPSNTLATANRKLLR